MDRRKSIGLIGVGSFLVSQNAFPSGSAQYPANDDDFKKAFAKRWEALQTHTFEVLESMPDSKFNFRPTGEVMPFAKLFTHMGSGLDNYAEILDGKPSEKETESMEKDVVFSYLKSCFSRFGETLIRLNPDHVFSRKHNLNTRDGAIEFYDYDILMLAYNHTVHHKGQATTYLRLCGIAPPQYRF